MSTKKVIAPIMVTIILIVYFSLFILGILSVPEILWMGIIGIIIALIFIGISIYNLVERIKEIRSGEYDDLSKYWFYYR